MKKNVKNEADILGLINNIQAQLIALDKKLDIIANQTRQEAKASPKPPVNTANSNDRNKSRVMHTAICADCKKECSIPFKPSGDRPVYCQNCFSRRKVISMSGFKHDEKPPVITPQPPVKGKKKDVKTKKPMTKKKTVPKKK